MKDQPTPLSPQGDHRAVGKKTVIIVAGEFPYPGPAGYLRYMFSFAHFLEQRGHDVHIVLRDSKAPFIFSNLRRYFPSGRVRLYAPGILRLGRWYLIVQPVRVAKNIVSNFLSLFPARFISSARRIIFRILKGPTYGTNKKTGAPIYLDTSQHTNTPGELRFAAAVFNRVQPEAVFFDTISYEPYCSLLDDKVTKYVITHDVLHERHQTFIDRGYEIRPKRIDRQEESQLLNSFDAIIAIQKEEAQSFAGMCADRDVVTVPYSVDLTEHNSADETTHRCLFAGAVDLQNVDGLNWFLTDIWPTIIEHVPAATLHVCGSVCQEVRDPVNGVVYRGVVPDLRDEYSKAALVIVPLRVGSGLKIKIVEALSHGRVCVTTSIGTQGLTQGDDKPYVIADEAPAFAAAVIGLLQDNTARKKLGSTAHRACLPFTAEAAFAPLIERGL